MKKKLLIAFGVFAVALFVLREVGVVHFRLYWHRGSSTRATAMDMRPGNLHDAGSLDGWKTVEVSCRNGGSNSQTRVYYTEDANMPWTARLPLYKFGHAKVSTRFVFVSDGNLTTGTQNTNAFLSVIGTITFADARGLILADSRRDLERSVLEKLQKLKK